MPPRKREPKDEPLVDRIIAQLDGQTLSLEDANRLIVAIRARKA